MPETVPEQTFSPVEAAQLLSRVGSYEENLTSRTFGLSLMLWSVFVVGFFFLAHGLVVYNPTFRSSAGLVIWVGAVLVAIFVTNALWRTLGLGLAAGFRPWRIWAQGLVAFGVGLILMLVFDTFVSAQNDSSVSITTLVCGLMAYLSLRIRGATWQRIPWLAIATGALVVADVGFFLWAPDSLPRPNIYAYVMCSFASGAALFVPGYLYHRAG